MVKGTFPHPLGREASSRCRTTGPRSQRRWPTTPTPTPTNNTGFWDIHDDRTEEGGPSAGLAHVLPGQGARASPHRRGRQLPTAADPASWDRSRASSVTDRGGGSVRPEPSGATRSSATARSTRAMPHACGAGRREIAPNTRLRHGHQRRRLAREGGQGRGLQPRRIGGHHAAQPVRAVLRGVHPIDQPTGHRRPASTGRRGGTTSRGFLYDGLYDYWSIAETFVRRSRGNTTACGPCDGAATAQTPSGAQSVAVYTDEHGEAQVSTTQAAAAPGSTSTTSRVVKNDNRGL